MILDGTLVQGPDGQTGLSAYMYMEEWLREFFASRSKQCRRPVISPAKTGEFLSEYEESIGIELAPEQREIISRIAGEPRMVFALAGYAGTGKTTICRAILDLLTRHFVQDREDVMCCAFTGMASSRIRKTTGYEAVTIHSLLKYRGENKFEHGPDNPLPHRVVLLDEASMVSLPLFYRLARALRAGTLLILVGDPAQLPPIGAGNVFGDALTQGLVPSVHLMKIFRQSEESVLALFANEIRQGRVPEGIDRHDWSDFRYEKVEKHNIYALKKGSTERELKMYREENNQAILDHILGLARSYVSRLSHPVWEFQVLTPMRVGQLGTEILNTKLQEILNTSKGAMLTRAGITIREGDKVVHLQNRDMPVMAWSEFVSRGKQFETDEFRRVFNGNVGLVSKIDHESEQFFVVYPERIVVAYDFDFLGDIIELAYALTVHKAQGSQYRVVVIPLTNSHFIMLNNKWFYTAVTRAEDMVYLVGQAYALKRACTNKQGVRRQTWLSLKADDAAAAKQEDGSHHGITDFD
jgi:exodeoxyribonuclease V alpha subunit